MIYNSLCLNQKIKLGLTGNIGAGKTYVSEIFSNLGIPVFNSDIIAKKSLLELDVRKKIIDSFGKQVYKGNEVNTKILSKIAFSSDEKLDILNSIIHPVVKEKFTKWSLSTNSDILVKESAILFESNTYLSLDKIICVIAPKNIRINRVLERDQCSGEEVEKKNEISNVTEKKEMKSDFIIKNYNQLVLPQILRIIQSIRA